MINEYIKRLLCRIGLHKWMPLSSTSIYWLVSLPHCEWCGKLKPNALADQIKKENDNV